MDRNMTRRTVLLAALGAGAAAAVPAAGSATAAVAAASPYDSLVLADKPKAYFQPASDTQLIDVVGGRNARFPRGHSWITVGSDRVPVFDGDGQYAEAADASCFGPAGAASAWTVEAWMRPAVLQFPRSAQGYVHWMGKGDRSGAGGNHEWVARMYDLVNDSNRPNRISGYAYSAVGGLGAGGYFQDQIQAGEWIHYALQVNHVTRRVYCFRDGVLRGSDSMDRYNIVCTNGPAPLRIGTRDFASYFAGAIGKVAFYTYGVPEARLRQHYEASPLYPGSAS